METLLPFSIPVKGLKNVIHKFEYFIDHSFFKHFEDSPVNDGALNVDVTFEKRPDLFVLQIDFKGTVKADCDRCLVQIDLPISDSQRLMVKVGEGESEDPDIIFIHPEESKLNIAPYIYEFVLLAMPMIKVYDCDNDENPACNFEMLKYLDENSEQKEEGASNPIWDELKKLDNLNN